MKINSKNSNTVDQFEKALERIVNTENFMDLPPSVPKTVKMKRNDGSILSIKPRLLENWLDSINEMNGVYFMEFDFSDFKTYDLYYSGPANDELLKMAMPHSDNSFDDPKKDFLDKLIFDLTLFNSTEPIVVWDKSLFTDALKQLSELYYEYADEVDCILERLVDMEQVFMEHWYSDSKFRGNTVKAIHSVLYPNDRDEIESIPMAMYEIYTAIENIFFQIPIQMEIMKMAA